MVERDRAADATTEQPTEQPTVKSATDARSGQIVLGKYSHLIWILSVVVIVILALVFWAV